MKTMKKIASLTLVLLLVLSLAVPALAAGETGSITIEGKAGYEYTVYKLFDLESYGSADKVENAPHSYTIVTNSPWYTFVTTGAGKDYVTVTDGNADNRSAGYVEWKEGADPAKFAELALDYAKENKIEGVSQTAEGEKNADATVTITGLTLGYYLVDSSMGALCALNTTNPNTTITEKNNVPTIEKEAKETPSIGGTVPYEVIIHAQPGAESYVLHDHMTDSIDFNNDVKAYVRTVAEGGVTTDTEIASTNYTIKTENLTDDCTFEVEFKQDYLDTITTATNIVLKYSATINEEAIVILPNNDATLSYGEGNETNRTEKPEAPTPVYSFDLVKTTSKNVLLAGAVFQLKDSKDEVISLVLVENDVDENNQPIPAYYRPAVAGETGVTSVTTKADSVLTFKGFGEGTYKLHEVTAPEGYNSLKEDVTIVISQDNLAEVNHVEESGEGDNAVPAHYEYISGGVQVINYTGAELPSTGGIGTTLFYIVGGLLIVGAAVLLITKKRVNGEQ